MKWLLLSTFKAPAIFSFAIVGGCLIPRNALRATMDSNLADECAGLTGHCYTGLVNCFQDTAAIALHCVPY